LSELLGTRLLDQYSHDTATWRGNDHNTNRQDPYRNQGDFADGVKSSVFTGGIEVVGERGRGAGAGADVTGQRDARHRHVDGAISGQFGDCGPPRLVDADRAIVAQLVTASSM